LQQQILCFVFIIALFPLFLYCENRNDSEDSNSSILLLACSQTPTALASLKVTVHLPTGTSLATCESYTRTNYFLFSTGAQAHIACLDHTTIVAEAFHVGTGSHSVTITIPGFKSKTLETTIRENKTKDASGSCSEDTVTHYIGNSLITTLESR
ncbi:MAG: hypothetical protein AAF518_28440, partial [Spirochaetota bacterium]